MATYNVFVKLLDGRTANFKFSSPTVLIQTLKQDLYKLTQIPPQHQRLITGTDQLDSKTLITLPENANFFTIHLLGCLLGGKGGFGSLLRGAASKAGQKKTNNFDACRDMSGRRLRHVNAEKRLQEWKDEEEERKLEKVAEDFIKKKNKEVKKAGTDKEQKYIAKYREDSRKCMEVMEASVRESLGRYEDCKRKMLPTSGSASKRLKLWMKEEDDSDSDIDSGDDDDDEDEKSVVLDDINYAMRKEDGEGSSGSVSQVQSDGESSGGGSSLQSNLEEESGIATARFELREGSESGPSDVQGNTYSSPELELVKEEEKVFDIHAEKSLPRHVESEIWKETNGQSIGNSGTGSKCIIAEVDGSVDEAAAGTTIDEKPLNFDEYNSAAELEILGMERLKAELVAHGLKCGGTLRERAVRLFLLKTTPLEMLPKKLFTKK